MMRVRAQLEIARELVDAQVTLRLVGSVATDAMLAQESFKRFRPTNGTSQAKAGGEEQAGEAGVAPFHAAQDYRIRDAAREPHASFC